MKGSAKVIERLNLALSSELTAIVQYIVQAELSKNWGYDRFADVTEKRARDEMKHAEKTIERIIFLDGMPAVNIPLKPQIGANVQEMMEIDLKDETDAIRDYNESVKVCREEKDDGSRDIFEELLEDEEEHADFLQAQLHSIKDMGLPNYLARQLHKGE